MRHLSTLALGVAGLVLLGGCNKKDQATPNSGLVNVHWMLVQVEETPIAVSSYSETYRSYIEFAEQNKFAGLGPCNSFSGTFAEGSTAGQLTISQAASTRAICPAIDIEYKYLQVLPRTARYEIQGKELRLYDATNSVRPLLIFQDSTK